MRNFIPKRDPHTLFYVMSSIFLIAVAAVLTKSTKINYDDYYFNTTEGDIYKLSLIAEDLPFYISNCTLDLIVNSFHEIVVKEISVNNCGASRVTNLFANFTTLSRGFVEFNVGKNGSCPGGLGSPQPTPTDKYGYFAGLYRREYTNNIDVDFEHCLIHLLQSAYDQAYNNNLDSGILKAVLYMLGICLCAWCSVFIAVNYSKQCIIFAKQKIKSDAKIKKISDQPLINSLENRRYDGINGDEDDVKDDNDSSDTSAARYLIS